MLLQERLDQVDHGRRRDVVRGQVHRDRRRPALGAPRRELGHALGERVPRDVVDEPGLLRERDERGRRQHPAGGVHPAHQRLEADGPARRELDLRLVVHPQLARCARRGGQRAVQVAQQHQAGGRRVVLVGGVHRDAGAVVLGRVHRDVRGAHQRRRRRRVVGQARDADRGVDVQRQLAEHERRDEQAAHASGEPFGVRDGAHVGQQDRELVAAQPRDDVVVAQRAAQAFARPARAARRPRSWPSESLMSLNRSMSRSMSPTREPVSSASRTVRRIRSASMRRLGSPVSESRSASRAFSSAVACSRRDAVHTVRNSTSQSASRPSATTSGQRADGLGERGARGGVVEHHLGRADHVGALARGVGVDDVVGVDRHVDVEDVALGAAPGVGVGAADVRDHARARLAAGGDQVEPVAVGEPGLGVLGRAVDQRAVEGPEPQLDQPLAEPGGRPLDGVLLGLVEGVRQHEGVGRHGRRGVRRHGLGGRDPVAHRLLAHHAPRDPDQRAPEHDHGDAADDRERPGQRPAAADGSWHVDLTSWGERGSGGPC